MLSPSGDSATLKAATILIQKFFYTLSSEKSSPAASGTNYAVAKGSAPPPGAHKFALNKSFARFSSRKSLSSPREHTPPGVDHIKFNIISRE